MPSPPAALNSAPPTIPPTSPDHDRPEAPRPVPASIPLASTPARSHHDPRQPAHGRSVLRARPGGRGEAPSRLVVHRCPRGSSSLSLMVDAPTKHERLLGWVKTMAELCEPDAVHWCDGSQAEYEQLCRGLVDAGTFVELDPDRRPGSYSGHDRPERRRPGRGPDLHLLRGGAERRTDQPLDGPGRDAGPAPTPFPGLDARPDDVRHPVLAWARSARPLADRRRAHRLPVRRRQHARS